MKRALFLDRDGIINADTGYVHTIDEFHFVDGICEICRAAIAAGVKIVVVTDQAGVGRGLFSEEQFHTLNLWTIARFEEQGVRSVKSISVHTIRRTASAITGAIATAASLILE